MKTVKMTWTLWPTTVCKAETRPCDSTQSFGKNMLPPSSSLTHLRFESSAVVQRLKVSWHILICLHATHPIQGTWGSHSKVSSLFSEVTQMWGQCTQLQKGNGGEGGGGCQKKSNITQTSVETRLWQQVCMRAACFVFFHFIPFIFCQAAASFVPEFGLVLLSGCSCSFCPFCPCNICAKSNKKSKSVSQKNKRLNLWSYLTTENTERKKCHENELYCIKLNCGGKKDLIWIHLFRMWQHYDWIQLEEIAI